MNLSTLYNLSFAFLSVACAVTRASDLVLDWDGTAVQAGVPYSLWGVGTDLGPITFGEGLDGSQCIRNVMCKPDHSPPYEHDPVYFFGANPSDSVVRVGQDYNIIFYSSEESPCNVWKINLEVGSCNHNFITTGGESGNPRCWNLNTWFQFELFDDVQHLYKIVFNPQHCSKIDGQCPEDIVLQRNNDGNRLYLNQRQFIESPVELHIRFTKHSEYVLEASE